MNYFDMNAQQLAHAAARNSVEGPTFELGKKPMKGFSMARANLWLTATADLEGVSLSDSRVERARNWLKLVVAVAV